MLHLRSKRLVGPYTHSNKTVIGQRALGPPPEAGGTECASFTKEGRDQITDSTSLQIPESRCHSLNGAPIERQVEGAEESSRA